MYCCDTVGGILEMKGGKINQSTEDTVYKLQNKACWALCSSALVILRL